MFNQAFHLCLSLFDPINDDIMPGCYEPTESSTCIMYVSHYLSNDNFKEPVNGVLLFLFMQNTLGISSEYAKEHT